MMMACGALACNFTGAGTATPEFELIVVQSRFAWQTGTKPNGGPNLKGFWPKLNSISAFCGLQN